MIRSPLIDVTRDDPPFYDHKAKTDAERWAETLDRAATAMDDLITNFDVFRPGELKTLYDIHAHLERQAAHNRELVEKYKKLDEPEPDEEFESELGLSNEGSPG